MAYLSNLHPEVYLATPRPGGVANIIPPPNIPVSPKPSMISGKTSKVDKTSIIGKTSLKSQQSSFGAMSRRGSARSSVVSNFDAKFLKSKTENSREYRIDQVLHSSGWMLPDYDDDLNISLPSEPINHVMMILSITLSTIMLMATNYNNISKDHLKWTLSYLECVKDEYGNYPPNVRGIMNHIKMIDDTLESFIETEIVEGGIINAATQAIIAPAPAPGPGPAPGTGPAQGIIPLPSMFPKVTI